MNNVIKLISAPLAASLLFACGSDAGPIEATQASIQENVFTGSGCAVDGCHGSTKAGNLDLRATAVPGSLINVTSTASALPLVDPGNAAGSFLVQKLENTQGNSEGDFMPLGGPKLSAAKIDAVKAWVNSL